MTTVLVVVPDYASHWYPLAPVATSLRNRGHHVVVASGPAIGALATAAGLDYTELRLGESSNSGVAEQEGLRAFFEATRQGMVATLRYQAEERSHDLFWEPARVARRLDEIHRQLSPAAVVVDQLSFGATAALRGLGIPFVSFLPGHPCQLPALGQVFGYPHRRPPGLAATKADLEALKALCTSVTASFTSNYNAVVASLDPGAVPVPDAFGAGGTAGTLVNYPAQLGGYAEELPWATFLGCCVRDEAASPPAGLRPGPRSAPRAYVSLGSFLSARADVLHAVVEALRDLGWDAIVATGSADTAAVGPFPSSWVHATELPQIAALAVCDVVVTHGGNNTVTETLHAGRPMLVLPFSTDQFAGAEDLRRADLARVADPNNVLPAELGAALAGVVGGDETARAAALGEELRARPGPEVAADAIEASLAAA
jgi:UDP:flavonoid glycosyltransferase YjiC (YdhE family)